MERKSFTLNLVNFIRCPFLFLLGFTLVVPRAPPRFAVALRQYAILLITHCTTPAKGCQVLNKNYL
jgi:Na+/H+ antiporter NhaD/arsenite permease-like protein